MSAAPANAAVLVAGASSQVGVFLLPRLLDIIYEINARFIAEIGQRWPGDNDRIRRMSLIQEGPEPMIRMAYLAIVGSFSVNGVAELHSKLLVEGLFLVGRNFLEDLAVREEVRSLLDANRSAAPAPDAPRKTAIIDRIKSWRIMIGFPFQSELG